MHKNLLYDHPALPDYMRYYANIRRMWNLGIISLTKKEVKYLKEFMQSIHDKGISEQEFMSHLDYDK